MAPGLLLESAPNCPSMKLASGAPVLRRMGLPSSARPAPTMRRPNADVAAAKMRGGPPLSPGSVASANTWPMSLAGTSRRTGVLTSCPVGAPLRVEASKIAQGRPARIDQRAVERIDTWRNLVGGEHRS